MHSAQIEYVWLGDEQDYAATLQKQLDIIEQIRLQQHADCVLYLQHSPVYTIGRTRDQSSLNGSAQLPHAVFETNRGGQATYHGPGQLVGYPLIDLNNYRRDLHEFLRAIELALIDTLQSYGVAACQREGLTGVWVEQRKIASIGVGVKKWISMHGFAININNESLQAFQAITPCGLQGVSMTSLQQELGAAEPLCVEQFAQRMHQYLLQRLQLISA